MSPRRNVLQFVGIIAALCMLGALVAGPASAKRMNAKQKAHVRADLRKQIKKNPKAIQSKSFIKKASLVNFRLPVTIALRTGDKAGTLTDESATANPNKATIDLGASLGSREIDLGGKLAAEIVFADSFDGGALGNVKLNILDSPSKSLTSTSVPLLWNSQVSQGRWDTNLLRGSQNPALAAFGGTQTVGCNNFIGSAGLKFGAPALGAGLGLNGVPFFATDADAAASNIPSGGLLPVKPGVDDVDKVVANKNPGDDMAVGGNINPFPAPLGPSNPNDALYAPTARDSVLRTNALKLYVATAGTQVPQNGTTNGPEGSQNIVVGKSGGEANLFGNIPGKAYGIDVTVNLRTRINSIIRVVDQDSFGNNLLTNDPYPAGIFGCRQIWTGGVDNVIPSVHLTGSLKIAPAITPQGDLRIAKATIATPTIGGVVDKSRVALAACLMPYAGFAKQLNGSDSDPLPAAAKIPGPQLPANGYVVQDADLPGDSTAYRDPPSQNCNAAPTGLVKYSAFPNNVVNPQSLPGAGYTTTSDGSKASVAGDLQVNNVDVDVLIGDN